jgi:hypothetical protein
LLFLEWLKYIPITLRQQGLGGGIAGSHYQCQHAKTQDYRELLIHGIPPTKEKAAEVGSAASKVIALLAA